MFIIIFTSVYTPKQGGKAPGHGSHEMTSHRSSRGGHVTCLLAPSVRHEKHHFQFEQPRTHQPRQTRRVKSRQRPAEVPWCEVSHERVGLSVPIGSPTSCAPVLHPAPEADGEEGIVGTGAAGMVGRQGRLWAVRPKRSLIGNCLGTRPRVWPPTCQAVGRYVLLEPGSADEVVRTPGCLRHSTEAG